MDTMKPVLEMLDSVIKDVEQALAPKSVGNRNVDRSRATVNDASANPQQQKKKKEKKTKQPTIAPLDPVKSQFLQCDLRVGRVIETSTHPESEFLYVLQVRYSEDEIRTICTGLRKHIPADEIQNRLVVTICNLKPRKLRGIASEGMVLTGSIVSNEGDKERIILLQPPADAEDGSIVSAHGIKEERTVSDGKFVSSKTWDKIMPRLRVKDGKACYDNMPLTTEKGVIICELPDGATIS